MVITRSPFRISFFGGTTDFPDFFQNNGGLVVGGTIDKYVYVSLRKRPKILSNSSIFTYSKQEIIQRFEDIEHPLIREIFKKIQKRESVDFHTFSDIPSRTGLGGSSSFCVALLKAVDEIFNFSQFDKKTLSKLAIYFERQKLKEFGGWQDQIWSSYGGLNSIHFEKNGNFKVKPLKISEDFIKHLEDSMTLVFTETQRSNSVKFSINSNNSNILKLAKLGLLAFEDENVEEIGRLLEESWQEKKKISSTISNNSIEKIENSLKSFKIYGKKLLGGGDGGFILVLSSPSEKVRICEYFKDLIFPTKFEFEGSKTIFRSL